MWIASPPAADGAGGVPVLGGVGAHASASATPAVPASRTNDDTLTMLLGSTTPPFYARSTPGASRRLPSGLRLSTGRSARALTTRSACGRLHRPGSRVPTI